MEAPVAQNIYHSKGDCIERFERLMSSPEVTSAQEGQYRRGLRSAQVKSAFEITAKLVELYDIIYACFPDAYNAAEGKFMRINAVKRINASRDTKFTKFTRFEVAAAIPEGFILPPVYGLQALLEVDEDGCSSGQPPGAIPAAALQDVVADYKSAIALLEYDPQKVGKSPEAYRMAKKAFEIELLRSSI